MRSPKSGFPVMGRCVTFVPTDVSVGVAACRVKYISPQFMDVMFVPLVAIGTESFELGAYGHLTLNILYSHSLVGALAIAAVAFWIGNSFWKSCRGGIILASLSFSHWILDVMVHRRDMPILPSNLGNFPLLGFGLWDFETGVCRDRGCDGNHSRHSLLSLGAERKTRHALVRWTYHYHFVFCCADNFRISEPASTLTTAQPAHLGAPTAL